MQPAHPTIQSANKLNILVVDDETSIRRLLPVLLHKAGHSVETASNGEEALGVVSKTGRRFDLVITDHDMPVVSGDEFVRRLTSTGFAGAIFVCSAYLTPELASRYRRLGVQECLDKPVPWEDLRGRVNAIAVDCDTR